jgi:hypothetical protein
MQDIKAKNRAKLEKELKKIGISMEIFEEIILNSPSSSIVPGIPIPDEVYITEIV